MYIEFFKVKVRKHEHRMDTDYIRLGTDCFVFDWYIICGIIGYGSWFKKKQYIVFACGNRLFNLYYNIFM